MDVKLTARVRKLLQGIDAESVGLESEQIAINQQLELLVAPGAPSYQEIVKAGRAYQVGTTTALAAVVAIPSTAQHVALYNGEPDGGRAYVIDWVAALNGASTAVATQAQILGIVGQVREAIPANSALIPKKLNGFGGGSNDTKARVTIASGTALPAGTGIANDWFPIGNNVIKTGVAATPGYGIWAPVDGRIIVAPGRYFATSVLASVVGETFFTYISWHEVQLSLG